MSANGLWRSKQQATSKALQSEAQEEQAAMEATAKQRSKVYEVGAGFADSAGV
jgi:hypothetical protein